MTISEKSFVGVDGFIELAKGRGLLQVTTAVGPGASGNECVVRLVDSEKATEYRYTMEDVEKQGCGHTHAWNAHPYEMFESFGIRNAIMDHYELSKCGFDRDETLLMQTYPDARVWEHAPQDWQIAAGNSGEIKTYGHKTREDAITCVANRIRAMKESKGITFAEPKAGQPYFRYCAQVMHGVGHCNFAYDHQGPHSWEAEAAGYRLDDCPFCGEKPEEVHTNDLRDFYIGCANEQCPVQPETGLQRSEEAARKEWNWKPEPSIDITFEEWWDEEIRLAQIHIGTGDYWVSKGIAEKAWNAARRGHRE